jgi:uncharacterized membrane protein YeaQ/YmgE (transglycosylase-associated protein family)
VAATERTDLRLVEARVLLYLFTGPGKKIRPLFIRRRTDQHSGGHAMGIISWIILGLIAGFIGSKLVDRRGQGFWLDIVLGIIGALVGGFLFSLFGASGVTGLNIYSMIVAIVGAVVVLLIYNALTGRRAA